MTQDFAGISSDPSDEIGDSKAEPLVDHTEGSPTASILIVDDDSGQRLLMRKVLENKGFEVIEAADGVEACRLNEEHHQRVQIRARG
jgi:PleD family two-component response regulator